MPGGSSNTEDRGFKALCEAYGGDAVAFFAPELIDIHGPLVRVIPIQQEVFPQDLSDTSTHLDVALLATWPEGTARIILMVEHHSQARKVRPKSLCHYITGMSLRHADAEVFPVLLVTHRSNYPVPDHAIHTSGRSEIYHIQWKVVRIRAEDLPRLRTMQNKVAAILIALTIADAPAAASAAVLAALSAGCSIPELLRFLPFIAKLSKMSKDDQPRFHQLIQAEVPHMRTFIDDLVDEAHAKGELAVVADLVAKGRLTVASARAEITELVAAGTVNQQQADEALAKLPKRGDSQAQLPRKKKRPR